MVACAFGGASSYNGHTCGIDDSGAVVCWGANSWLQLGGGFDFFGTQTTLISVAGLSTGVSDVAVTDHVTCALSTGGGVSCWGYNTYGALGVASDDPYKYKEIPHPVPGLESGVTRLWAHDNTVCVLQQGVLKCWGDNHGGVVGAGSTEPAKVSAPLPVVWGVQ